MRTVKKSIVKLDNYWVFSTLFSTLFIWFYALENKETSKNKLEIHKSSTMEHGARTTIYKVRNKE